MPLKTSTKTTKLQRTKNHTPKRVRLDLYKDARVHCAVLKQPTTPTPPDPPTPPTPSDKGADEAVRGPRTGPYQAPHQPVAGDLRTQQCARQAPQTPPAMFHHHTHTHPEEARASRQVLTPARPKKLFRQCSTHEQPPTTRTAMAWHLNHPPTSKHQRTRVGSSLERR